MTHSVEAVESQPPFIQLAIEFLEPWACAHGYVLFSRRRGQWVSAEVSADGRKVGIWPRSNRWDDVAGGDFAVDFYGGRKPFGIGTDVRHARFGRALPEDAQASVVHLANEVRISTVRRIEERRLDLSPEEYRILLALAGAEWSLGDEPLEDLWLPYYDEEQIRAWFALIEPILAGEIARLGSRLR